MKRFLFLALVVLSTISFAQTNAWSSWTETNYRNSKGDVVEKHIKATFTLDSLGVVLLSKPFDLRDFGVINATNPIAFKFKTNTVSTANDTSATCIRLMGCYQSVTDTVAVDTLRDYGGNGGTTVTAKQVRGVDSLGVLEFNAGRFAPQYRIAVQGLRRDTGTSYLDLIIRKYYAQ